MRPIVFMVSAGLGYNVSVAATDTFIREIRVDTGSQPDPVAIVDLLRAQQEHHGLKPPKLIYDKAAWRRQNGTRRCPRSPADKLSWWRR
jgi:hypothetical protein